MRLELQAARILRHELGLGPHRLGPRRLRRRGPGGDVLGAPDRVRLRPAVDADAQGVQVQRLHHHVLHADRQTARVDLRLIVPRQRDHRGAQRLALFHAADLGRRLDAVEIRQLEVHQDEIEVVHGVRLDRFRSARCRLRLVAGTTQSRDRHQLVHRVVLDHQDAQALAARLRHRVARDDARHAFDLHLGGRQAAVDHLDQSVVQVRRLERLEQVGGEAELLCLGRVAAPADRRQRHQQRAVEGIVAANGAGQAPAVASTSATRYGRP